MSKSAYGFRVHAGISAPVLALGSALATTGAHAADTPAPSLEEVVVTAQKRAESIQEVPIAITALSAAELASRGVRDINDLARQVPGVIFGDIGFAPQLFARGIGFNTVTGVGEGPIAVHVDGAYLPHPASVGMLQYDLERMEFLRGPQGTLYGRNAIGGVLNLLSAQPAQEFGGGAFASYGNYDAYQVSGYLTGPITDTIRARIYVENDGRDGFVKNLDSEASGQSRYVGSRGLFARLSLDFDLSEDTTLKLRAFNRREHPTGPVYKPLNETLAAQYFGAVWSVQDLDTILSFDPYKGRFNEKTHDTRQIYGATARLDHDFGDIQFVSISAWSSFKNIPRFDGDGTVLADTRAFANDDRAKTYTQEFNLLYNGTNMDWIVGAYYLRDDDEFESYAALLGPGGPYTFVAYHKTDQAFDSGSVFGDLTYRLTDRFSLYGGARAIFEKIHFKHNAYAGPVSAPGASVPPPPAGYQCTMETGGEGNQKYDQTDGTGRFGARYELTADSSIYAQYSRGYKSAIFDPASCTPPSKPEHMDAFEVGTKNTFMDGTVTLNASAYYYDYKNTQVEDIIVPIVIYRNTDSRIYGLDIETTLRPVSAVRLNLGVNLMSAKFTQFVAEDFLNVIYPGYNPDTNLDGHYLNRAPVYTINLGAQYDHPLSSGSLRLRTDLYSSDKYYLRPYNLDDDKQSSFVKIDASVAFMPNDGSWQARAFIKNATDKAVLSGMFNQSTGQNGIYDAPRTYGLELSYKF